MTQLYFYVEGNTERAFVDRVLAPHLAAVGVWVMGAVQKPHRRTGGRGGLGTYAALRRELAAFFKLHDRPGVRFTTMFDLYALPTSWPGRDAAEPHRHDPPARTRALEQAFAADLGDPRLIPHLQLHEFEALFLADLQWLPLLADDCTGGIADLAAAVVAAGGPELVDDGAPTAPSRRITALAPSFGKAKAALGVEWAAAIGLPTLRAACPQFGAWLAALEALAPVA